MFEIDDAYRVACSLDIVFDKFTPSDLLAGMNIELEHGLIDPNTNVTNDNPETTAKIALAHLNEFPNYYNPEYGLSKFEEFLKLKSSNNQNN